MTNVEYIRAMLMDVAKNNKDDELCCFYLDPINKIALAGYRRIYGIGDCLVRITAPDLQLGHWDNVPGIWDYNTRQWFPNTYGLKGRETADSSVSQRVHEHVGAELAHQRFEAVFNNVIGPDTFGILINPKAICDFLEDRTRGNMQNIKISLHVYTGIGMWDGRVIFPGVVETSSDGIPLIRINNPNNQVSYAFIDDQKSFIPVNRLRDGQRYVVQRVSVVEGRITVRVLREFRRGVRIALQHFKDGLLMPGMPRYSVFQEPDNSISDREILDLPFVEHQVTKGLERAPMMHFDADTLYRTLKPMTMHALAEMRFRNSVDGVLVSTIEPDPNKMRVDAIISPTSPYKSGKIYTE